MSWSAIDFGRACRTPLFHGTDCVRSYSMRLYNRRAKCARDSPSGYYSCRFGRARSQRAQPDPARNIARHRLRATSGLFAFLLGPSRRSRPTTGSMGSCRTARGSCGLSTQDRLQRYDGYEVREYPDDPNGPSAVYTRSRCSLTDETRFGAGGNGIGSVRSRYRAASSAIQRMEPFTRACISTTEDRQGILWFSANNGLSRTDPTIGSARSGMNIILGILPH